MDINTRDIGYFLAVAHAGNLAGASRACHVTEAALSKAIGRVEIAVGFPVFEAKQEGMVLTQAGKVIHTHAVRIRHEHDDTMSLAADMRSGVVGFLRVGATRPVYDGFVAPAIAQLIRKRRA
ncbi:MAG: LysR family transcriptional regulator [Betaproteobacteria bacterium]|nr:LysR family transcriptional regulator [Betaproteobacteria bacterium]